LENLTANVSLDFMFYNFARLHKTLAKATIYLTHRPS